MKLMTPVPKIDERWYTLLDAWKKYPFKKRLHEEFLGGAHSGPTYVRHDQHTDKPFSLPYNEWRKIIETFFKYLLPEIYKGRDFHWPHIGRIGVRKHKHARDAEKRKLPIDFNETKKVYGEWNKENPDEKKYIYYDNSHTNDYIVHSYWSRKNKPIRHGQIYKFRLSKTAKSNLAKALKNDHTNIYRIEEFKRR